MDLVAHELTHVVQDLGDLDRHLREETVLVPHKKHFHEELLRHVDVVEMGNDLLLGGAGNDLIVGDSFLVRSADVALVPRGSPWHAGHEDDWQDRDWKDKDRDDWGWHHHHHHDHDDDWAPKGIRVGADVIEGRAGDDLVFGDNLALQSHTVTRGEGLPRRDYDRARDEAHDGLHAMVELTDAATYWLAPQGGGHHHHHHDGHWHFDKDAHFDNGDHINGGDGDDVLFGQDGDDHLHGDAGDDWLIGGEGDDRTDGGPGKDKIKSGNDSSSHLRRAVGDRLIDWSGAFDDYGLRVAPFAGLTLDKGGQSNFVSFAFLSYDRPKSSGWDD